MKNKEPMKSQCWRCGKVILSNKNSVEFLYGKWTNDLKPFDSIALVCKECFEEKIKPAFNGLQDIDLE